MPLLTKSRFKLALSCPTKLFYNDSPDYENQKTEDKFLEACISPLNHRTRI